MSRLIQRITQQPFTFVNRKYHVFWMFGHQEIKKKKVLSKNCCPNFPRKLSSSSRSPSWLDSQLPPKRLGCLFLRDRLLGRQATCRGRHCCSLSDPSQRIAPEGCQLLCHRKAARLRVLACRPSLLQALIFWEKNITRHHVVLYIVGKRR